MLLVSPPEAPPVPLVAASAPAAGERWFRLALLAAWVLTAGWLAAGHVMWRDEVRAFTIALSGDSVWAMLRNLQGEGHPALWYLLLRGAHGLFGVREVLPGLAFAIAAAAAALLALRAPFRPLVLGLTLFGAFFLDEYAVLARNYGISMLLMFAFAALYGRWRDRGVGLGVVLALLANTNAHSVLIAGALALFWGIDLLGREGWRWTPAWRRYAANMALLLGGVLACFVAVYPPAQDAVGSPLAGRLDAATVLLGIPGMFFALLPDMWWEWRFMPLLLAVVVIGSPLGLLRRPSALAAAVAVMVAMPLFFMVVYPGVYRHQALYVCLLVTLYWLVADGHGGRWPAKLPRPRPVVRTALVRFGQVAFVALLTAQALISITMIGIRIAGIPYSRSRDLAVLLERERLGRAVVMADTDMLLEPLPYYAPNPVWQTRPHRFGHVVGFTKANVYDLHLGQILADARAVRASTGRPVVIVTQLRLDPTAPPQTWSQGYVGKLSTTPAEVSAFLAATRPLARFAPARTDESYDVYLLR
jgi:hypothetical protein